MTLAEQKGYTTRYYNDYVSGGTHQQWNWYGIKIDDFDNEHLENNFAKVVKILEDVGITPQTAANFSEKYIYDFYMR